MAEIQANDKGGKKKGKQKKMHIHVDFTPMVDMNMLLICFFMLATTMQKPQTMEISVPSNKQVEQKDRTQVGSDRAVTVLLGGDNRIFYIEGQPNYEDLTTLQETSFDATGLRKFLLDKNAPLVQAMRDLKDRKARLELTEEAFDAEVEALKTKDEQSPIVVIKASDAAVYKNLVDVLDEMQITNISKYSIATITPADITMLETKAPGITVPKPEAQGEQTN